MWRNTLPLPEDTPQFYDMEVFNRCVQTRNPIMSLECWGEVHPALVTLPVDWPFTIPMGFSIPFTRTRIPCGSSPWSGGDGGSAGPPPENSVALTN